MKSLFGWGSIKIEYSGSNVEFETSFVSIGYQKLFVRNTTINGKIIEYVKGYRAVVNAELLNYDSGDSDKFVSLIGILNASQAANGTLTITPRYSATDLGSNWSGEFVLDSDIIPEEIAKNVFVGQRVNLAFIGTELLSSIPDHVSESEIESIIHDESDDTSYLIYDESDDTSLITNKG